MAIFISSWLQAAARPDCKARDTALADAYTLFLFSRVRGGFSLAKIVDDSG